MHIYIYIYIYIHIYVGIINIYVGTINEIVDPTPPPTKTEETKDISCLMQQKREQTIGKLLTRKGPGTAQDSFPGVFVKQCNRKNSQLNILEFCSTLYFAIIESVLSVFVQNAFPESWIENPGIQIASLITTSASNNWYTNYGGHLEDHFSNKSTSDGQNLAAS